MEARLRITHLTNLMSERSPFENWNMHLANLISER